MAAVCLLEKMIDITISMELREGKYLAHILKTSCYNVVQSRSVIDTKESDGIADPMEKIAIKSHSDHSDSGIGKMLIVIGTYFVIILLCNNMTK